MTSHSMFVISFLSLSIQLFFTISGAIVPSNETFTYVNEGEFGLYVVEYDADYRSLPIASSPFRLHFYNTTPNAYTLAILMGTRRSENRRRWVWEANRGNPVRENATLTFGTDGNLVLADADGRVTWQTNTANKGVVGLKLLPNGNMVLHDGKGIFIWQSFDSPTDTLLVGQSLRIDGVSKLVSRGSVRNNINGPYSFVLEPQRVAMYYKSTNSPRPMAYWSINPMENFRGSFTGMSSYINFTLNCRYEGVDSIYDLYFNFHVTNAIPLAERPQSAHVFTRYNSTLTYLRLGIDGNLRYFTFSPNLQNIAWDVVYTFLDRDSNELLGGDQNVDGCQLPERCGKFGLCEDSQCVGCPTPNGLFAWSKGCDSKKVTSCKSSDFGYYKLEGVDHFMIKYTTGDKTEKSMCESKCTSDCKCMGYFYHTDRSRCWIAYELKTLTRVGNSTNLAYIKTPNK